MVIRGSKNHMSIHQDLELFNNLFTIFAPRKANKKPLIKCQNR